MLQRPVLLQKNSLTFLQNAGRVSTGLSPSDALNGAHSQELPHSSTEDRGFPICIFTAFPLLMKGRLRNEWAQTADLSPTTRHIGRIMWLLMLPPHCHTHQKELAAGKNENLSHNFHLLFKVIPHFERSGKRLCCGIHTFTHTYIFSVLDKLL